MRKSFLRDEAGAIAIVFALVFPIMVGALALGAEAGFWYYTQRKLQHAADLAAHAGAVRLRAGDAKASITTAAHEVAVRSGFADGATSSLTLNLLSSGGRESVEVILVEAPQRMLSSLFASGPVPIRGRAVASLQPLESSVACVLALDPVASGAVSVGGSATVDMGGCDIAANSNAPSAYLQSGSSSVKANCINTVGGASPGVNLTLACGGIRQQTTATRNPYANVADPVITGACEASKIGSHGATTVVTPTVMHPSGVPFMRFCSGIDLAGTVVFSRGLYIIEGNVTMQGGAQGSNTPVSVRGADVTFFFQGNTFIDLKTNTEINFAAPTTGPYAGLALFGAKNNTRDQTFAASPLITIQGAVYYPSAKVDFSGSFATTSRCTQVIGLTIAFSGNQKLQSDCANTGTRTVYTDVKVAITE